MPRANVVNVITPLIERQLEHCLGRSGGHDDEQGHWTWQSAAKLAEWLESYHRIRVSPDTVARALSFLVDTGRWVRAQLGKAFGHRSYYYRRIAELTPQEPAIDTAMERPHAELTPEKTTTDPDRCAVSEPVEQPKPKPTRPVPRGFGGSPKPRKAPKVSKAPKVRKAADDGMFSSPASAVTAKDLYERPSLPAGLTDADGWLVAG